MTTEKNIIGIMERTLNNVDSRLIDHGKRVSYLVYKILKPQNMFTNEEIHDICVLALLHDIGAYKTEEIEKMVVFETTDVWEHSIYGYMFLKYLSPLSQWAPVILYHHGENKWVQNLKEPKHQILAQMIHLCDRADISYLHKESNQSFVWYMNQNREVTYRDEVVNMYLEAEININMIFNEMPKDKEFDDFLYHTPMSTKVTRQYLQMTMYSIYFKNEYKMKYSHITSYIPVSFAGIFNLKKAEVEKLIEKNFVKNLEEIGIPKKFIRSAKKIGRTKMNNKDFLEDILMLTNLFLSLYSLEGYKNSCPRKMVVDILSDLTMIQGLKTSVVDLAIEGEFKHLLEQN